MGEVGQEWSLLRNRVVNKLEYALRRLEDKHMLCIRVETTRARPRRRTRAQCMEVDLQKIAMALLRRSPYAVAASTGGEYEILNLAGVGTRPWETKLVAGYLESQLSPLPYWLAQVLWALKPDAWRG